MAPDGREQGFWAGAEVEIGSEIYEEQPVAIVLGKEAKDESAGIQHRSIHSAAARLRKHGVGAAQRDKVFMQQIHTGILLTFGEIEFRSLEGIWVTWVGKHGLHFRKRETAELREEFRPA